MKCVGVQYLAAIRAMKQDGVQQLKRTIHVMFVPDEEVGGVLGMMKFSTSNEFKAFNVGFSLDEGIASPIDEFNVFYAERCIWEVTLFVRLLSHFYSSSSFIVLIFSSSEGDHHVLRSIWAWIVII